MAQIVEADGFKPQFHRNQFECSVCPLGRDPPVNLVDKYQTGILSRRECRYLYQEKQKNIDMPSCLCYKNIDRIRIHSNILQKFFIFERIESHNMLDVI